MIRNFLLVVLRNIKRYIGYALINLVSLAIGMAIFLWVWQFVSYEKSYDQFHENKQRLYRLEAALYDNNKLVTAISSVPCSAGSALKAELPEIADYARLYGYHGCAVRYKDAQIEVANAYLVEDSFFNLFSFPLVKGNPATVLKNPQGVVLSESMAKKIFGNEDPVGKVIDLYRLDHWTYTVTGVFKDVPHNSHLQFDLLLPIRWMVDMPYYKNDWERNHFHTYLLLHPHADVKAAEAKLPQIAAKYIGNKVNQSGLRPEFRFQPITDIYLHSPDPGFKVKSRNILIIYFSSLIALFILIIAWINYINLSTARSMERAKEVGIRKVVGAARPELIRQFFFESGCSNLFGLILALFLVKIFSSYFNRNLDIPASFSLLHQGTSWLLLVLLLGLGTFFTGIYPAFLLSSFNPNTVLKGKIVGKGSKNILRKILVVFQLVISIFLISGTVTIYRQLKYMQSQDLGIKTDKVLLVHATTNIGSSEKSLTRIFNFFDDLMKYPEIVSATLSDVPGGNYFSSTTVSRENRSAPMPVARCWMDYGFLDTFGIPLVAGRNFSKEIRGDRFRAIFLNQTAVKALEFESPEKALDQFIVEEETNMRLRIIGVLKDYHQKSLREPIRPVIFQFMPHYGSYYHVLKLDTDNIHQTIAMIKEKYEKEFPGCLFDYRFLDEYFNQQYKVEEVFVEVFRILSILAVFIACIGILGLFAYTTLQRTKEIGIRKVFGAEPSTIFLLLVKDLVKLFVISMLIVYPIGYYLFDRFLQVYAYRITLGVEFFLIPLVLLLPILLLITLYHVVKAALQNPINALRYE